MMQQHRQLLWIGTASVSAIRVARAIVPHARGLLALIHIRHNLRLLEFLAISNNHCHRNLLLDIATRRRLDE